ncbi:hypothetical protein BG011_006515 [Mortierella polycephala]|uniref:Tetratricopeptide repeat protein 39B n=1 Tax=Mortierella polycephala TaxID=41804 RepID=A0A9P6PTB6_9FUNG|nr:hypothetical protein BG011_006515 [Mortierella polycephala]
MERIRKRQQEPSTVRMNPSRRTPHAPPKIKKPVPNWHHLVRPPMSDLNPRKSYLERAMDDDLKELRVCMDLFLDAKMNEAEAMLLTAHKPESMYYQFGRALVHALRAILTFHPDEIEKAMRSFDETLKIANKQRKTSAVIGLGTVKAFGSWVIGTVGGGSFRGMTRMEKHAELVYAEATVLRAGFSILYHQDFWSLLEETVSLRSAFAIFNGLKSHFDMVEQELKAGGDITEHYLDEHLVTGLIFAVSLFNIVISFLPDTVIKLLQFVGFSAERDWGQALLNTAGEWDPNAGPDNEIEFQERLNSPTNIGIRRQICDLAPIAIHLIAASFLPFRNVDYAFAERINEYNLHKYPGSMVFQFLKGRHAQVNTRLDDAIAIYEGIKVQPEWRNLTHVCVFEQLMCAMMESDYDLACTKSRVLLRESNWTKTIFRYLAAITTMRRGLSKEAKRVPELMKKVEPGMQKFCGIEVFPETYCARKANRYLNEGGRLLLPDYDFLVLWNGFETMPLKSLRVALSNIMIEVERLDNLLPASMLAISGMPLPKSGYTLEATSGILSAFLSGVHTLTKADKLPNYDQFYDDYCIAYYLLGLVAKNIAFFPEEPFDADMCTLAVKAFKTVFRYAPYIKDDTYSYYFSHYNLGLILMNQGELDQAEEKFKYLLNTVNVTLIGLPALVAGKGRNSLEILILAKAHAAMFLLNEDRERMRHSTSDYDGSLNRAASTSTSISSSSSSANTNVRAHAYGNSQTNGNGLSGAMAGLSVNNRTTTTLTFAASSSDLTSKVSAMNRAKAVPQIYHHFPVVDTNGQS